MYRDLYILIMSQRWFDRIFMVILINISLLEHAVDGTTLKIGLMSSHGGSFNSSGVIPAAQVAVSIINANTDILGDYELELVHDVDSQCNDLKAVTEYFRFWKETNNTAAIFLGGGCSLASEPIASISRFWETVQIAYVSSSPKLSNGSIYSNFFRVIPSETHIHKGQGALVSLFGWNRVALVNQHESIFVDDQSEVEEFLKKDLKIEEIRTYQFISQFPLEGLSGLWEDTPRVIVINAYQVYTREVLCQAYRHSVYYPAYQFIILGLYDKNMWKMGSEEYQSDCSFADIRRALNNAIAISEGLKPKNVTGISGLNFYSLNESYSDLMQGEYGPLPYFPFALRTFDAIFLAALALNNSIDELGKMNLSLGDFDFDDYKKSSIFANVIRKHIRKLSFQGMMEYISFQKGGSGDIAQSELTLMQLKDSGQTLQFQEIGEIDANLTVHLLVSQDTIFPKGIPRDVITTINPILFGVMTTLAIIGMVFAVVCLLFNLIFFKRTYIKLTSPLINITMCVGAIVLYSEVIVLGIPTTNVAVKTSLCNLVLWIASIGFTLLFGSLLIKTWRIYFIFQNVTSGKIKGSFKPPKDWVLLIVLAVLLLVDVLYLTIVTAVPSSRFSTGTQRQTLSSQIDLVCKADAQLPILAVLLVYKSIYLWIGLFLAFETRKVKIKALNDAKFIAAAVYCAVVTCIPLVVIGILLTSMLQARYGTLSGGILLGTSIILGLLFLPRMVVFYKIRNDDTVDGAMGFTPASKNTQPLTGTLKQENEILRKRLQIYESQMSKTAADISVVESSKAPTPDSLD